MGAIGREIGHLLIGIIFLTRIPVPVALEYEETRLARAARYFPLVGLLIGGVTGAAFWLASQALPGVLAAGLALAFGVLLTGALHEDGFADCCDGLGGGSTRERALEIMRDSRIGAYGAAGLVFSIGLRWGALSVMTASHGASAILVGHAVSRGMIPPVLAFGRYARADGLARSAADVTRGEAAFAVATAVLIAMVLGPSLGLGALAAAIIAASVMVALLFRRLGGYTGDGLGAVQQVAEISVLIFLAAAWT
ncbi:MAG: adenosylcobinamide-GDP ribazoletransferase [Pseudomonadota bacterium]